MNYISDVLFWISTGMLVPVIILLIFFFLRALLLLGGFFGQYLVKRKSGAEIREQMNTLTLDNIDTLGDRLPKNKQSKTDLKGAVIGVQLGTTSDGLATDLEKEGGGTKVERYNKGADAIQALLQGKIDCMVTDEAPAKAFQRVNPSLRILPETFDASSFAICVAKDHAELQQSINHAIRILKENGVIDSIVNRHLERGIAVAYTPKTSEVKKVGPEALHSAMGLNSTNFNLTRMIGPVLAAFLLNHLSYSALFFMNAASLIPILFVYRNMNVNSVPAPAINRNPFHEMKSGFKMAARIPAIITNIVCVGIISSFLLNFSTYGPLFSDRVLHRGLGGFGSLLFFIGLGSMIGGLLAASSSRKVSQKSIFNFAILSGILLMMVSYITIYALAMALFTFLGFMVILFCTGRP